MALPLPRLATASENPAERLFAEQWRALHERTDRMFAGLMLLQWLAGIGAAFLISPKAWSGAVSVVHPHVWAAIWIGGALCSFPVLLAWFRPGHPLTRHTIAVAQMLTSALLVHLSGGRVETHFHVFGSLAFLAFYRDWKVLLTATVTVALEHWFRGAYWPESIYGVALASPWRWVEHAGWVVFEIGVLAPACLRGAREMRVMASRQAELEAANNTLEADALERRRLLETLSRSEREFRVLAESIPQIVWTISAEGKNQYYNRRWTEYTGAGMEESLEKGWSEYVAAEDLPACIEEWTRCAVSGSDFQIECRLKRGADGALRWHLARATAVRDEQGSIVQWFGTSTDIDDQKRLEKEREEATEALRRAHEELEQRVVERTADLTKANEQLQQEIGERVRAEAASARLVAILESTSDLVGISDTQFQTQYLNKAGYALLGIPAGEDLNGRESRNAYSDESWKRLLNEALPTALHEGIWSGEIAFLTRDGREIPTSQVVVAHRDAEGQVEFFSTIARDVSEQRRAAAAVREREAMLRSFYDSAAMMMGVVELDDEQIIHISDNVATGAFYGIEPGAMANRTSEELGASTETAAIWKEHYLESARLGQPVRFEYEDSEQPGCWLAVTVSHIGLAANGRERFSYVAEDVSDAHHAAEALKNYAYQLEASRDRIEAQAGVLSRQADELGQARDQALEASRAKSAFLANMSHELRTPLNAILGYSEMLMEDAADSGLEEWTPDLQKIRGAGEHLLGLINDILDLSKIEAGKMDLHLETFSVSGMLEAVLATARPLVAKNGNRLEVSGLEAAGEIFADQQKVRQVLLNLLSNAAKFTREGAIRLEVRQENTLQGDGLRIDVSDTGIGMTEEQVGRLFQEFTQGDSSTTRKYGGTGLGLAITRRFCELMGGTVHVASREGEGSTFTLWLPAVVKPPVQEQPAVMGSTELPVARPNLGGDLRRAPLVLVIDDDPTVHDLMRRSLTKEGFRVETASDGEEGLRRAGELHPDAITLDVMMPGIDGWAVLAALKHDAALQNIPVVMLTMVDNRSRGYTLGVTDYLTKPFQRDALVEALRRHCAPENGGSILIVEDDEQYRGLLRETLGTAGWEVVEAADGIDALRCLEEQTPQLILLDLSLPRMDGFEFMAELSRRSGSVPPVVVLTACNISDSDRERFCGAVGAVLDKSSTGLQELLGRVRDELSATVASCPAVGI
jgi:PAS domain S-box-containing protein